MQNDKIVALNRPSILKEQYGKEDLLVEVSMTNKLVKTTIPVNTPVILGKAPAA